MPTKATITDEGSLAGQFCSKTIFNLSQRALSDFEIQVLKKALDVWPLQRSLNDPELRKDFEEFACRMRIKWNFQNETSDDFSHKPGLELLLTQVDKDFFEKLAKDSTRINSNMTKKE